MSPKATVTLLLGITGIVVSGVIAAASLNSRASLEPLRSPMTQGQIVDGHFIPSHVETIFKLVNGRTKGFPMSLGPQWQLTLRSTDGREEVWNVTEAEYNASQLGEEFLITHKSLPVQELGVAVD